MTFYGLYYRIYCLSTVSVGWVTSKILSNLAFKKSRLVLTPDVTLEIIQIWINTLQSSYSIYSTCKWAIHIIHIKIWKVTRSSNRSQLVSTGFKPYKELTWLYGWIGRSEWSFFREIHDRKFSLLDMNNGTYGSAVRNVRTSGPSEWPGSRDGHVLNSPTSGSKSPIVACWISFKAS